MEGVDTPATSSGAQSPVVGFFDWMSNLQTDNDRFLAECTYRGPGTPLRPLPTPESTLGQSSSMDTSMNTTLSACTSAGEGMVPAAGTSEENVSEPLTETSSEEYEDDLYERRGTRIDEEIIPHDDRMERRLLRRYERRYDPDVDWPPKRPP